MTEDAMNVEVPRPQPGRRGILFAIFVAVSSVVLSWMLLTQPQGFESPAGPAALVILLVCTIVFLRWIPNPIAAVAAPARRGRLIALVAAAGAVLFVLPMLLGARVLFALPVLAVIVLLALREKITRREGLYALILAVVAALAGLGSGWVDDFPLPAWAALQLALVSTSLLCGWKIFERTGLAQQGVGRSRFLTGGVLSALRGFSLGTLMSIPWALTNVLLGGSHDVWVKSWWQPIIALQPGIAEEAWGRVLMVSLLFLVFRKAASPRTAFTIALVLAAYWFAYLHTQMGLNGLINTLLLGTLYALPISYLCLYRDLETAVGFHFLIDFVRYLAAYLVLRGGG